MGRLWFVEVEEAPPALPRITLARVSSADQKTDLDRRRLRLLERASPQRWVPDAVVTEVGCGLIGARSKLLTALADPGLGWLGVEHRDRLVRFGFDLVDALWRARGGGTVVVDDAEVDDDLVSDMTEILTSMCARLQGWRSAKRRAQRAVPVAAR